MLLCIIADEIINVTDMVFSMTASGFFLNVAVIDGKCAFAYECPFRMKM